MTSLRKFTDFVQKEIIGFIKPNRALELQIDITNACNLQCSHCYHSHHKNDGALSLESWKKVIDQYAALIAKVGFSSHVIICGGEPLTSNLLDPILNYLAEKELTEKVMILTNGTLSHRLDFELLAKFKRLSFQVSIDGPTPESHDQVRGAGNFSRALKGVQHIQSRGHEVHVLATLSKRNSSLIGAFFDLAKDQGFSSMGFTRFIENGTGKKLVEDRIDRALGPDELRESYLNILFHSGRTGIKSSVQKPLFQLLHPSLGKSGRFGEALVVNYKGKILASSRSRIELGDVFSEGLEKVLLENSTLMAIRQGKVEGCGQCPLYKTCGGDRNAAFAETGNYLGLDPGCWLPKK